MGVDVLPTQKVGSVRSAGMPSTAASVGASGFPAQRIRWPSARRTVSRSNGFTGENTPSDFAVSSRVALSCTGERPIAPMFPQSKLAPASNPGWDLRVMMGGIVVGRVYPQTQHVVRCSFPKPPMASRQLLPPPYEYVL